MRLLLGFLLLFLSTTLVAQSPQSDVPSDFCRSGSVLPRVREQLKDLTTDWEKRRQELHVPGFSVAVVCGSKLAYLGGFGQERLSSKDQVTPDSLFYLASSTKSLTALAAVHLAHKGKLDLNAPVNRYLPRFTLADKLAGETITVQDLLAHRRGLTDIPIMVAEALTGEMNDDRFYRLLADLKPREKFVYSNLHYTILQRVLEEVTGKKWPQVLHDEVFKPLRMANTTADYRTMIDDPHFAGMIEEVDGKWISTRTPKHQEVMNAAGGAASTARDLSKLMLAMLNDGKVDGQQWLPKGLVAQLIKPEVSLEASYQLFQRTGYGDGWYDGTYKGLRAVHHFGSYEGAHAHLSFLPDRGIGVVVLVNMHEPVNYFAESIAGSVYDKLLNLPSAETWQVTEAAAAKARAQTSPELHPGTDRALIGDYVSPDWGTLHMSWQDDSLHAKLGIADLQLDFQDGTHFTTWILGNPVKGEMTGEAKQAVITLRVPHKPAVFIREK